MLHDMGKKAERDPNDVVTRLVDCHARIREMLALAGTLATSAATADERAETAGRVRRYFRRALPFHVRDEEDSIAPRLASAPAEVASALARMTREHATHDALVDALVATCEAMMDTPEGWAEIAPELGARAAALGAALAPHLEAEERVIFPAIAALGEEPRAAIAAEMNARREADGGGRGRGGGGGGRAG